ncbi:MAG: FimB/Mfa2 family fimbrial subunit [Odoribacteraceae bacterium]|jgi:hypothetical protein|nr:FimB/Mfa2 family fimbrial subunit [Odoribacteraceae bacterium]
MRKVLFIPWALAGLLPCSCIRENLDDCPRGIRVCLRSAVHKYKIEDVAREACLYLYDSHGDLADTFRFPAGRLSTDDYAVVLPPRDAGRYTLVALLNPSALHYEVTGVEALTSFRAALKPDRADTIARRSADLFHAHKVVSFGANAPPDTLYFYKNTVHFNVRVRFEDRPLPPPHLLSAVIDGNNGIFDYLNAKSARRRYLPYAPPVVAEDYHYRFQTMDFRTADLLALLLSETTPAGVRSIAIDIAETLGKVTLDDGSRPYDTDEELAQEDDYTITVALDANLKVLELTVNDWYTIKGGLEL